MDACFVKSSEVLRIPFYLFHKRNNTQKKAKSKRKRTKIIFRNFTQNTSKKYTKTTLRFCHTPHTRTPPSIFVRPVSSKNRVGVGKCNQQQKKIQEGKVVQNPPHNQQPHHAVHLIAEPSLAVPLFSLPFSPGKDMVVEVTNHVRLHTTTNTHETTPSLLFHTTFSPPPPPHNFLPPPRQRKIPTQHKSHRCATKPYCKG